MSSALPPQAYAAALSGFEQMSIHRLAALLRHHRPDEAFAVAAGDMSPRAGGLLAKVLGDPGVREQWRRSARQCRPEQMWEQCCSLGIQVTIEGDDDHPPALAIDPLPPPVLFSLGERSALDGRRVAIVGTRNATAAGRHIARSFGSGLAEAGVHVVSGLARGIDGHAHGGVIDAIAGLGAAGRPIAVVASGLDVVYPPEHRLLWQRVADAGVVFSEWPPGSAPAAYRFPLRNRLVASLSEIVVVVESREVGGSLITAGLAADRGVPVMAVPGSALNRASAGVNGLLRDGSAPAIDVDDVLIALGLDHSLLGRVRRDARVAPRGDDLAVYQVCRGHAGTIGEVAAILNRPLLDVAMALARLEQTGWLAQVDGWFEAAGSPLE
jgi:DNA processing protein